MLLESAAVSSVWQADSVVTRSTNVNVEIKLFLMMLIRHFIIRVRSSISVVCQELMVFSLNISSAHYSVFRSLHPARSVHLLAKYFL